MNNNGPRNYPFGIPYLICLVSERSIHGLRTGNYRLNMFYTIHEYCHGYHKHLIYFIISYDQLS